MSTHHHHVRRRRHDLRPLRLRGHLRAVRPARRPGRRDPAASSAGRRPSRSSPTRPWPTPPSPRPSSRRATPSPRGGPCCDRSTRRADRRSRDRGHDLRLLRRARREEAEPAARGRGDREPAAGVGARDASTGRRDTRRRWSPPSASAGYDATVVGAPHAPAPRPAPHEHHGSSAEFMHHEHGPVRARPVRARDGARPRHGPGRGHVGPDRRARHRAAQPPAGRERPHGPRAAALDDPRAPVHRAGSGWSPRSRCPSSRGPPGRSTGPRSGPPGTAPRPWTRWSRSASSPRPAGRCGRCCSAVRASSG